MNFDIDLVIDHSAYAKSELIRQIEKKLKNRFETTSYGEDIKNFTVFINCTNPPIGFEKFSKIQKPKYISNRTVKNQHTQENITFEKHFFCSISITGKEFENFCSFSDELSKDFIKEKLRNILHLLDSIPKKVKDFNKDLFYSDLVSFLSEI